MNFFVTPHEIDSYGVISAICSPQTCNGYCNVAGGLTACGTPGSLGCTFNTTPNPCNTKGGSGGGDNLPSPGR